MEDRVGGGFDDADGTETRIDAVENVVEQVARVPVGVIGVEQMVAGRSGVVDLDYEMRNDFALHTEEPVVDVGDAEVRRYGAERHARARNSVDAVQPQLQRRIHGITQVWRGGISQRVRERGPELRPQRGGAYERRIGTVAPDLQRENVIVGKSVAAADAGLAFAVGIPGETEAGRQICAGC